RHAAVGRGADAAEHRLIGNGYLVAPVDLAVANRADMRAVRTVGAEPFSELLGVAGARGALADRWLDLVDRDSECVARLSAFDINRASLGIAVWLFCFVAAIGIGADLAAKGVFGFDDDRFARLNAQSRLVVAGKFVVEG